MKKLMLISACMMVMFLITVGFSSAQDGEKNSAITADETVMLNNNDRPLDPIFGVFPVCTFSTDNTGISAQPYYFVVNGQNQKAPTPIICYRDRNNTGLCMWEIEITAQGTFDGVMFSYRNSNDLNIKNVKYDGWRCTFEVWSESPTQIQTRTLTFYMNGVMVSWDIVADFS